MVKGCLPDGYQGPQSGPGQGVFTGWIQPVYGTNTYHTQRLLHEVKAGERLCFKFDFVMNIGEGNHSISTSFSGDQTHLGDNYEWVDRALVFQVVNTQQPVFVGSAHAPPAQIRIVREE